ncbi:MAG: MFS transporter [Acidobacteriota bacterium]|nr:MFS transporter [Acidobacteriota bacterium]
MSTTSERTNERRIDAETSTANWLPAFSMMLVSFISYVDRSTLAVLAPVILQDTHLNAEQYGFIISCFSFAYMLANPLWGRILDRWNVRQGMSSAVSIWSLAAVAHAWATGFFSFAVARTVLGAGEGATFPGGLRTVTQTLPPKKRGRGLAIAYSGGSLGAMVTPFIVTPIALRYGWHGAFIATGSFGFAWLILWAFVAKGVDQRKERTHVRLPWRHPALWAYISVYALGAMPLGFILYDSSLYLHARFGWDQAMLGKILWVPPAGWELGYFVWGWIIDRFGPRFKGLMIVCLVLSLPLAWMHSLPTGPLVLAEMFLAMFALAGFVVLSVAYATRAFPADHAGLLAGIGAGSWGAVIAMTSPWFGRLFDHADYATAFRAATVFPIVGYALWRVLSRAAELER